jgi:hypothetical protein
MFAGVLSVALLACCVSLGPAVGTATFQEVAPNEVRVYLHPGFAGQSKSWVLQPGQRQILVQEIGPPWEGQFASIQAGSEVGVMLFQQKGFKFVGSGYTRIEGSIPDLKQTVKEANPSYSSLIVFQHANRNPVGILAGNSSQSVYKFYPLPEMFDQRYSYWADVRLHLPPIDFVMFFSGDRTDEKVLLTLCSDISFKGDSLKLNEYIGPGVYHLADYKFEGRTASLMLDLSQAQSQPLVPKVSNLAGKWQTSDGRTFEIAQQGENIVWMDMNFGLQGKGHLDFDRIDIIWYELYGAKTGIWTIVSRDGSGLPTKIDIGNGLELTRLQNP